MATRHPDVEDVEKVEIREWASGDEEALAAIANSRRVWRNLTDRFPHPYTLDDATDWVATANDDPQRVRSWAVVAGTEIVGGVGFERLADLGSKTAEVGYWIGEPYWGRGMATAALRQVVRIAFEDYDFVRLQASVIDRNAASCRVLEKAGFAFEARLRSRVFKDGEVCDQLLYVLLRATGSDSAV